MIKTELASVPWDEDLARKVITRLAQRKLPMFAAFPDYSIDDLVSEGLIAARRGWPRYDAAKAAASTFIYITAARRLIDVYRRRDRLHRQDAAGMANNREVIEPESTRHEPSDLAEWLASIRRTIAWSFGNYQIEPLSLTDPESGETIDRTQAALLLALRRRAAMPDGELCVWLWHREDLLDALGLLVPPSVGLFVLLDRAFPVVRLMN